MEWFTKQTFGSLLDSAAERMGDRPALTFEGKEFSFLDLQTEAHGVARALIASEVSPGEIVALWMDNRPEWIHTQFGTALAGATLLPVNTNLRANDLAYILRHSRCSTLILASRSGPVSYQSILEDVLNSDSDGSWSDLKRIVVLDADVVPEGWLGWSDFLRAGSTVSDDVLAARAGSVSPDDPALVMYTSGTTGKPKGVVHSHHAIRNVTDQANRLGVTEVDVTVIFLPLFHAYGFYEGPLLTLVTGARMVLLRRFQPDETLKAIEDERGTMCFGFVTHFSDLLSSPNFAQADRSTLRASIMAVGPLAMRKVAYETQRRLGGKVVSGFGMTEIGPCASLGFLDEDEVHSCETSGYPLSGYGFRVIDPDSGEDCERGVPGEVLVRTYQVTSGYSYDPQRTAELVDPEGWLHTGDLGVQRPDGYVQIVGRYKDQLRVGGENVDPSEVEAFFLERTTLIDALLVGIPDERLGEVPCMCVIVDGDLTPDVTEALLSLADGEAGDVQAAPTHRRLRVLSGDCDGQGRATHDEGHGDRKVTGSVVKNCGTPLKPSPRDRSRVTERSPEFL